MLSQVRRGEEMDPAAAAEPASRAKGDPEITRKKKIIIMTGQQEKGETKG